MVFTGAIFLVTKHSEPPQSQFSSCPHARFFSQNKSSTPLDELLTEINQKTLQQHTKSSRAMLNQIQHVIIFFGGELSLWQKNNGDFCEIAREKTAGVDDSRYVRAKQVSHIALLLISRFSEMIEQKEAVKLDAELFNVFQKLLLIQKKLITVNDAMKQQYQHIVRQSILLLKQVHLGHLNLESYVHAISKDLNALMAMATSNQLTKLHEVMMEWSSKYSLLLEQTRVLLPVVHGPRDEFLEHQYFCNLFENTLENHQANDNTVFCIEMLPRQMGTLDLKRDLIDSFLAKSELDKKIGKYAFGNERAMYKDILHEHAKEQLQKMFVK